MLFSSITFLYFFLPITLVVYFLVPEKLKNGVLCLASFFFYAWGEPIYCLLLLAYICIGFFSAYKIEGIYHCEKHEQIACKQQNVNVDLKDSIFQANSNKIIESSTSRRKAKLYLIVSITLLLGGLFYFKYLSFLWENISKVMTGRADIIQIVLPVGISFYTFQVISYVIDVYNRKIPAEKSFLAFATYVSLFPQLIAGPIVRYETIREQIHERTHMISGVAYGCRRLLTGLAKKVMIADLLGEFVAKLAAIDVANTGRYWMIAIAFMLQIYYDFSGYSDMAIGLGSILGFQFPENFDRPFLSKSITEFWRRWHMTLSSWMRDYLYIPLGGNRVSTGRWIVNMLLVWGFSGLWHGAGWNFIWWGLYFGVFLILEKKILGKWLAKRHVILQHVYALLVIVISFVLFRVEDVAMLKESLTGMFFWWKNQASDATLRYQMRNYMGTVIIGCVGVLPIALWIKKCQEFCKNNMVKSIWCVLENLWYICLLILSTAFLINSSFHPFLYFRF